MTDIVTDEMFKEAWNAFGENEDMRAAITAALAAMWRPIAECPDYKEGIYSKTEWLLYCPLDKEVTIGNYDGATWLNRMNYVINPTHFAPLICPPAVGEV